MGLLKTYKVRRSPLSSIWIANNDVSFGGVLDMGEPSTEWSRGWERLGTIRQEPIKKLSRGGWAHGSAVLARRQRPTPIKVPMSEQGGHIFDCEFQWLGELTYKRRYSYEPMDISRLRFTTEANLCPRPEITHSAFNIFR